jgi:predicted enzyme related to lactoylglutathione lyase
MPKPEVGTIGWIDLSVPNADKVRDFYKGVVGWTDEALSMGEYNDYVMKTPESQTSITGICHKQGVNADIPSQWLIYITVADLDKSASQVEALGGKILVAPKSVGSYGRMSIVQDPGGAIAGLFEHAE